MLRCVYLYICQERLLQLLFCDAAIVQQALSFGQGVNDLLVLGPGLKVITRASSERLDYVPQHLVPQEGCHLLLCLDIRLQHLLKQVTDQ